MSTNRLTDVWLSLVKVIAALMLIPAFAAFVVWLGCVAAGVSSPSYPLLVFAIVVGGVSLLLWRTVPRPIQSHVAVNSAAVALAWIVASVLCAVPIVWVCSLEAATNETAQKLSEPLNAWYESTSSISSSGLTTAAKSSEVPASIQLWRSALQWFGGVGLAVFALLVIDPGERGNSVYAAETRTAHLADSVKGTVYRVLAVYAGLTILCGIGFQVCGMPIWETVNHALVTTSTGGLTVTDDSFTSYNRVIQVVAATTMLAAALSFGSLYFLASGQFREFTKRTDLRVLFLWTVTLVVVFLFAASLRSSKDGQDSVFNVISAISTCGVSSGKISEFAITSIWLMIVAMFIGGCSDSTAGGVKLNRASWMTKVLLYQLRVTLGRSRDKVLPTWDGMKVDADEADQRTGRVLILLFLFMLSAAIGFLVLRLSYDSEIASDRVLFQTISSLSAVGLSMDLTGPDRPTLAKLAEIILMIAGRLEIMALLLIAPVLLGRVRIAR